jgi:hypothetical protein
MFKRRGRDVGLYTWVTKALSASASEFLKMKILEKSTRASTHSSIPYICLINRVCRFVCAHLTADEEKNARRLADYHYITRSLLFNPLHSATPCVERPSTIFDTSHLFFFGDLNFRLELPKSHPHRTAHQKGEFAQVLDSHDERLRLTEYDQLVHAKRCGSAFVGLREGEFWKFKCRWRRDQLENTLIMRNRQLQVLPRRS